MWWASFPTLYHGYNSQFFQYGNMVISFQRQMVVSNLLMLHSLSVWLFTLFFSFRFLSFSIRSNEYWWEEWKRRGEASNRIRSWLLISRTWLLLIHHRQQKPQQKNEYIHNIFFYHIKPYRIKPPSTFMHLCYLLLTIYYQCHCSSS